MHNTEKIY